MNLMCVAHDMAGRLFGDAPPQRAHAQSVVTACETETRDVSIDAKRTLRVDQSLLGIHEGDVANMIKLAQQVAI